MPVRKISEKQFQMLYERNVPQMYRAALVMMGDRKVAERAVSDAFLQTMIDSAHAADDRTFSDQALRLLCRFCRWETSAYDPAALEGCGLSSHQADLLSRSTPNERILLALSAMLSFREARIAAITGWPKWAIVLRLRNLARGMRAEERYFLEEEALLPSKPVQPF